MNILLTSGGRRDYLVHYFKDALAFTGGKVHVANCHSNSPAFWCADQSVVVPGIRDNNYIDFILNYCLENSISLIVPLLDLDIERFSQVKELFELHGITIPVATPDKIGIANDKWETYRFLMANDIPTLKTYCNMRSFVQALDMGVIDFPVFVKPRFGMATLGVEKVNNFYELEFYFDKCKGLTKDSVLGRVNISEDESVLIQEAANGDECMMDIVNNLDGEYQISVLHKKIIRRIGETEAAEIILNPLAEIIARRLSDLIHHPCLMDVDLFIDGNSIKVLELNPRFGGGYPFTHSGGVNVVRALIDWVRGVPFDTHEYFSPNIGSKSIKGISVVSMKQEHQQNSFAELRLEKKARSYER